MDSTKKAPDKKSSLTYAEAARRRAAQANRRSDPLPVLTDPPTERSPSPVPAPIPILQEPRASYADAVRRPTSSLTQNRNRTQTNSKSATPGGETSKAPRARYPQPALPLVPLPALPLVPLPQIATALDDYFKETEKMSTTENADKKEAAAATDGKDDEKNEHGMRTALESLQISDNENTNLESTVSETMVSEDNKSVSRSSDKGKGPATTTGPPGSVHQDKTIVIQGNDAAKQQQPQGVQGASGSRSSSSAGDDPEKQKAEDFRETMLRALDQGNKPMWENQLGWDVMIRCKGASWRVHRSIIVEQSPEWIAKHIPPPGEGTKPTVWVLQSHDKHQLGNVLKFMYYQEYDNAEMDPEKPLEAASIVTNVAMYIAGMSVLCRPMMDYALTFIEDATDIIQDELPKLYKGNIDSLEESIRRGLKIMYEQGNEKYLWSLRVVMAKLMDVCMLYLLLSPGWPTKYVEHWRMLIPLVKRDNEFFREAKMLRPLRGKERTDGQQDGTEDKAEGSA